MGKIERALLKALITAIGMSVIWTVTNQIPAQLKASQEARKASTQTPITIPATPTNPATKTP